MHAVAVQCAQPFAPADVVCDKLGHVVHVLLMCAALFTNAQAIACRSRLDQAATSWLTIPDSERATAHDQYAYIVYDRQSASLPALLHSLIGFYTPMGQQRRRFLWLDCLATQTTVSTVDALKQSGQGLKRASHVLLIIDEHLHVFQQAQTVLELFSSVVTHHKSRTTAWLQIAAQSYLGTPVAMFDAVFDMSMITATAPSDELLRQIHKVVQSLRSTKPGKDPAAAAADAVWRAFRGKLQALMSSGSRMTLEGVQVRASDARCKQRCVPCIC